MWETGLGKLAELLLAPVLDRAVAKLFGDPATKAMAAALEEAIDEAVNELVPEEHRRAKVREILRQWPHNVDPHTDPVTPDGVVDASELLTAGVRRWVAAVDTPVGEPVTSAAADAHSPDSAPEAPLTRLASHGVDSDALVRVLDRSLRAAIAKRARPGGPLAVVQDRLDASAHHRAMLEGFKQLGERVAPPAKSAYLRQVEQIAPVQLRDRYAELTELADFCTAPDQGPYVWWRAGAWAGKTALLSTFVLHPPPRVRMVSFFITARYAGHSDHVAFTDVVIEQLAELLGQPVPTHLTDATRHSHLWEMLDQAAHACQQRGERLVLVVDGLDEDRGVTTGPDAHSIAAMLPARPPAGMRVVVAGRPSPPIPDDVPDDHPLRDPGIVRTLSRSPHAQVAKNDLTREIKRLLTGTPLERDLLGLVCAAGGGLTAADLTELTGAATWEIEDHLSSVVGRSFRQTRQRWTQDQRAYVLAHEELQQTALTFLRGAPLDQYRQRIHTWADTYRDKGWPANTPEYLLRGYFPLLRELDDLPRMVTYATDQARHDRMLDLSGGDTAALAEVATAQQAILHQDHPDLLAMARLAIHRDDLTERNTGIPAELPALWAHLGYPDRAVTLAQSLTHRDAALAAVVEALAATNEIERAERVTEAIDSPGSRSRAMGWLFHAAVDAGDRGRADALARRIVAHLASDDFGNVMWLDALVNWAVTLARFDPAHAEELARSVLKRHAPEHHAMVLGSIAYQITGTEPDRARSLVTEILRSEEHQHLSSRVKPHLPLAMATLLKLGDTARAERVFQLVQHARAQPTNFLPTCVAAAADAGDFPRAETLAATIGSPMTRIEAVTRVAAAAAAAGDHTRAVRLCTEVQDLIDDLPEPRLRGQAFGHLAWALATTGDHSAAEELTALIPHPDEQAKALVRVAYAIRTSNHAEAVRLARRAEQTSRSASGHTERCGRLVDTVTALCEAGDHVRAEQVARSIDSSHHQVGAAECLASCANDPDAARRVARVAGSISEPLDQMKTLVTAVRTAANRGQRELVYELADEVETAYESLRARTPGHAGDAPHSTDDAAHATVVAEATGYLAAAVAATGDLDRACRLAHTADITDSSRDARAAIMRAVIASGDLDRANQLIESATHVMHRDHFLAGAAVALADEGNLEAAAQRAGQISSPMDRPRTLAYVAEAAARHGDYLLSARVAGMVDDRSSQDEPLAHAARAAAEAHDFATAEDMARRIEGLNLRVDVFASLARAATAAGDAARAYDLAVSTEEIARSIDPLLQPITLSYAVRAYAGIGDVERACELADSIIDPNHRAIAYARLAEDVPTEHATRLLSKAFALSDATIPLPALARVQPRLLSALADDHLSSMTE